MGDDAARTRKLASAGLARFTQKRAERAARAEAAAASPAPQPGKENVVASSEVAATYLRDAPGGEPVLAYIRSLETGMDAAKRASDQFKAAALEADAAARERDQAVRAARQAEERHARDLAELRQERDRAAEPSAELLQLRAEVARLRADGTERTGELWTQLEEARREARASSAAAASAAADLQELRSSSARSAGQELEETRQALAEAEAELEALRREQPEQPERELAEARAELEALRRSKAEDQDRDEVQQRCQLLLREAEEELRVSRDNARAVQELNDELQTRVEQQLDQLGERAAACGELQRRVADSADRLVRAEAEREDAILARDRADEAAASAQGALRQSRAEGEAQRAQTDALRGELVAASEHAAALQAALEGEREAVRQAEARAHAAADQLALAEREAAARQQGAVDRLRAEVEAAQLEMDAVAVARDRLADDLEQANRREGDLVAAQEQERREAQGLAASLSERLRGLQGDCDTLKARLDAAAAERDAALRDRDAAQRQGEAAEAARRKLEADVAREEAQRSRADADVARLTREKSAMETELLVLQHRCSTAVEDSAAYREQDVELRRLRAALSQMRADNTNVSSQLHSVREELARVVAAGGGVEAGAAAALRRELEALRAENASLRSPARASPPRQQQQQQAFDHEELALLRKQNAELRFSLRETQQKPQFDHEELALLRKQNSELRFSLRHTAAQLEAHVRREEEGEADRARPAAATAASLDETTLRQQVSAQALEISRLQAEAATWRNCVADMRSACESRDADLLQHQSALETRCRDFATQVRETLAENSRLAQSLDKERVALQDERERRSLAERGHHELRAELAQGARQREGLERECAALRRDLLETQHRADAAASQLAALSTEARRVVSSELSSPSPFTPYTPARARATPFRPSSRDVRHATEEYRSLMRGADAEIARAQSGGRSPEPELLEYRANLERTFQSVLG